MLSIISKSNYAPFNIATEEYLLKSKDEDCFLLYINSPSIIVGKHQNTLSEINYDFVKENAIPVVRRMTGGGTVFHDLGNLNFCFIMRSSETPWTFERYTQPILDVLQELGVNARFEGRNDLTIDGKKFSGNAKLVWQNKILQHGTILFTSKMADLSQALKTNPLKFSDKAVKSVRSRVTNVSEHLKTPLSLNDFTAKVLEHVHELYPEAVSYAFSEHEVEQIQALVDSKYNTWDWNYGTSPKYNFYRTFRTAAGTIEIFMNISKGTIQNIRIYGDYFGKSDTSELEAKLQGKPHEESSLNEFIKTVNLQDYFGSITHDEFIGGLF